MLWHAAAAALVAAAVGTAGGWKARGWVADRQAAETAAAIATERETAMHAALIETTRRLTAQQEAARAAANQARQARADAADAAGAAERLRQRAAELAASAGACDSAAAAGGPADRLADVLAQSVERYREVAAIADRAIGAGQLCQQSYDSLDGAPIMKPPLGVQVDGVRGLGRFP